MSLVLTFDFLQIRIQTAKNTLFSCGEVGRQCVSKQIHKCYYSVALEVVCCSSQLFSLLFRMYHCPYHVVNNFDWRNIHQFLADVQIVLYLLHRWPSSLADILQVLRSHDGFLRGRKYNPFRARLQKKEIYKESCQKALQHPRTTVQRLRVRQNPPTRTASQFWFPPKCRHHFSKEWRKSI